MGRERGEKTSSGLSCLTAAVTEQNKAQQPDLYTAPLHTAELITRLSYSHIHSSSVPGMDISVSANHAPA